jgi:hypothetical protein
MANSQATNRINDMPRTGEDAKDFHSGCIAIQAAIKQALATADVPAKNVNVSWTEPMSPVPQIGNLTVTAGDRTATLAITRERIMGSYERVGDPELLREIRDLLSQLTR